MQGNRITVLQQEESESWIIGGLDYSWRVEQTQSYKWEKEEKRGTLN